MGVTTNGVYDNSLGSTVLNRSSQISINGGRIARLGNLVHNGGIQQIYLPAGELSFNGNLDVSNAGVMGGNFSLGNQQKISLSGTTTVNAGGQLNLNGGSLPTGQLVRNCGAIQINSGALNITGGSLSLDSTGPLGNDVILSTGSTLRATNGAAQIVANAALTTNGGKFTSNGIDNSGTVTFAS